jgi:hypothetical protein
MNMRHTLNATKLEYPIEHVLSGFAAAARAAAAQASDLDDATPRPGWSNHDAWRCVAVSV